MMPRQVGKSGLTVSALGLGCMGMSQSYGPGDDEESTRTIHRALDLGVTLLDTADVYGRGANETIAHFGEWLDCVEHGEGCVACREHGGPRCTS